MVMALIGIIICLVIAIVVLIFLLRKSYNEYNELYKMWKMESDFREELFQKTKLQDNCIKEQKELIEALEVEIDFYRRG